MATLVLIHGFLGSPRSWDAVREYLPTDIDVRTPCLPGHGAQLGADFMSAVSDLIADLPARSALCGYSLGGRLALHVAQRAPDRVAGLLLLGAHPGLTDPEARAARIIGDETWAERFAKEPIARVVDDWRAQPIFASQSHLPTSTLDTQRGIALAHRGPDLASSMRQLTLGRMPRADLARLEPHTTLCTGALDEKFTLLAEAMAAARPGTSHEVIPGVGHNLPLECPEAVADLLNQLRIRAARP